LEAGNHCKEQIESILLISNFEFIEPWLTEPSYMLMDIIESIFFQTFIGAAAGASAAFFLQNFRDKKKVIEKKLS
jgi:hypothetical protein